MKITEKVIIEDEQGNCYDGMLHGKLPDCPDRYVLSLGEQIEVEQQDPPTNKELEDLKKDLRKLVGYKIVNEVSPEISVTCRLCPDSAYHYLFPCLVDLKIKYDLNNKTKQFFDYYYGISNDAHPIVDRLVDMEDLNRFFKGNTDYKQYKKELKSFSKKLYDLQSKYEDYDRYIFDELEDVLDFKLKQMNSR